MKKLLLILLCLPFIGFGQTTYVPDANFEAYLEENGMGNGIPNDSLVTTANINTVTYLDLPEYWQFGYDTIYDLTGIEDFTDLYQLDCSWNYLTNLDLSQNSALYHLSCFTNQLTSLNINGLTNLRNVQCQENKITNLDVSSNTDLEVLWCRENELTSLNLANGKDSNWTSLYAGTNPDLYCITVDNGAVAWFTDYFTSAYTSLGHIDEPDQYFSNNCSGTGIKEHTTNKERLKVTDLLGRETKGKRNELLFYIYDDGTVEKRIVIE